MTTLDDIHAELERLRNHRFLLGSLLIFALALFARAIIDARQENRRAIAYREIAIDAMNAVPPELVDPIMLAIAGADDAN